MTFCSNWRNEAELCLIPISCPRSPSSSSSEIFSRSLSLWQLRRKYSEFPRVVHSFKFAGIWIWDSSESQICNHFLAHSFVRTLLMSQVCCHPFWRNMCYQHTIKIKPPNLVTQQVEVSLSFLAARYRESARASKTIDGCSCLVVLLQSWA